MGGVTGASGLGEAATLGCGGTAAALLTPGRAEPLLSRLMMPAMVAGLRLPSWFLACETAAEGGCGASAPPTPCFELTCGSPAFNSGHSVLACNILDNSHSGSR